MVRFLFVLAVMLAGLFIFPPADAKAHGGGFNSFGSSSFGSSRNFSGGFHGGFNAPMVVFRAPVVRAPVVRFVPRAPVPVVNRFGRVVGFR